MEKLSGAPTKISIAPKWLQLLTLIAKRTPSISVEGHLACVVAPPSADYFPGALGLLSTSRNRTSPKDFNEGQGLVASLVNENLRDREHSFTFREDGAKNQEFLGQTPFKPGTFPPVQKLPIGFPHRGDGAIPAGIASELERVNGESNLREACWSYFELCINPVVIICQKPSKVAAEIEEFAAFPDWWSIEQLSASVEPATSPDDWFRRPIICMSPRSSQNREWLQGLTPSAIIVIGFSAWSTPSRWLWPDLPHTLFLDPKSDDVVRFRTWHDGQEFPPIYSEFASLKGIPGMPVKLFQEHKQLLGTVSETDWDDYGADFE